MLALMPRSQPPTDLHTPATAPTTTTMSLALLPSSAVSCVQDSMLSSAPSPAKRPKLSLDTTDASTPFAGKRSTSLRLETLSATSPTARNTFGNAYEQASQLNLLAATKSRAALPPLATSNLPPMKDRRTVPERSERDEVDPASSSSTSPSSLSTVDSLPKLVPYKLGFHTSSILTNGPIQRIRSRRKSSAQSKPMFPASKKVAFRAPLTEEVKTEKYTLRHSDIESSSSTISTLELTPSSHEAKEEEQVRVDRPRLSKRKDSVVSLVEASGERDESYDEEANDSSCPATPVAGRRKKDRQWIWTLGPVKPAGGNEQRPEAEAKTADHDDLNDKA